MTAVTMEDNPAATRGFALALGGLPAPAKLLAPTESVLVDLVLDCLVNASL